MDVDVILKMVFGIIGGLGIFLLGMKNMSEGMQAVAGARLRKLIGAITNNRFMACGVGTMVTCLIQSSSVTTVMVVGMVNAGIMTLMQAIGVILGANIGTTITGWILVLKIGKYGLPLLGISAFFYLFSRRDRVRFTASVFLGLGMIFYGLQLMKLGFAPLKDMPEFIAWFSRFSPTNYFGVLRCVAVGAVLTAVVQSSSATLGITIGLASTGVIDLYTAAALVLGENIGTTITAYLASLGASTNAKRASYAHMLINVIGVLWVTAIFWWFMKIVVGLVGTEDVTRVIATTHTLFNVTNTIVFLPLMGVLSKLLYRIMPETKYEPVSHLRFLDVRMLDAPAISIEQSRKEIVRMSEIVDEMLDPLKDIITSQEPDSQKEEYLFEHENRLDLIQKEVMEFLSNIMAGNIAHDVAEKGRNQLRMADEYESISDYVVSILKLNLKLRDIDEKIDEEGQKEILDLHENVSDYVGQINETVRHEMSDKLKAAKVGDRKLTHLVKEYRSKHLARVGTGTATPLKSLIYTDMLNSYRRIKDHALNIAEVMAGEK